MLRSMVPFIVLRRCFIIIFHQLVKVLQFMKTIVCTYTGPILLFNWRKPCWVRERICVWLYANKHHQSKSVSESYLPMAFPFCNKWIVIKLSYVFFCCKSLKCKAVCLVRGFIILTSHWGANIDEKPFTHARHDR